MSTPREQYHEMLDELPAETKLELVDHIPFAKLLEDTDPVAYRCGLNDMQFSCDECSNEFWADDPDEPAICEDCKERIAAEEAEEEEEDLPQCAIAMRCLCAGHARGNPAEAECCTSETPDDCSACAANEEEAQGE